MKLRLATWNINSVRLRLPLVEQFIAAYNPDVLCLQEIKCPENEFPHERLIAAGFRHIEINGQPGYNGVAVLSRLPLTHAGVEDFCNSGQARHLAVRVAIPGGRAPVHVHNVYIPSGGDEPNPATNPKFAQKLEFLRSLAGWAGGATRDGAQIMVGDFNIAPLENDVWSHKALLDVVSHTPLEVDLLARVQQSADWVDVVRRHVPAGQKLYTWWSYRAKDWRAANRGRRLDHIWVSPVLADAASSVHVADEARGWEKPSDHVPVIADFNLPD
jgi:exodeoxyribonuclease III